LRMLSLFFPGHWGGGGCCQAPRGSAARVDADDAEADAPSKLQVGTVEVAVCSEATLLGGAPGASPPDPSRQKGSIVVAHGLGSLDRAALADQVAAASDEAKKAEVAQRAVAAGGGGAAAPVKPSKAAKSQAKAKASALATRRPPKDSDGKVLASPKAAPPLTAAAAPAALGEAKRKARPKDPKAGGSLAADGKAAADGGGGGGGADGVAEHPCPGQKMVKRVSYLQKVKEERARQDAKAKELAGYVDDMLAGRLPEQQKGGGQPKGNMLIKMPSPYERVNTRKIMLEGFRDQYRKIAKQSNRLEGSIPSTATEQYSVKESEGLSIKDGHRHMPRPKDVQLPKDFRKFVGSMPLQKLTQHDCNNQRKLVSVYGDIFDVSDRPDKYGADGPYGWMSGHDLTWGFVSGKDIPEQNDQLYDMWKMAPDDFREKKLHGLLAWVAFYEHEYGKPVGRLKEYEKEAGLKGPPMEEAEDCCIM